MDEPDAAKSNDYFPDKGAKMTEKQPKAKDPAKMTYEEARDELTAIVASLEGGAASLDESLTLWERGESLAKRCTEWLDSAQARLDSADKTSESSSSNAELPATDPDQSESENTEIPELARPTSQSGANDETAPPPPPNQQPEAAKPKLRPVPNTPPRPQAPNAGKPTDPPW
jgi:exodeoxyribonuclease VII small subunit